jgi:hypothetical protein
MNHHLFQNRYTKWLCLVVVMFIVVGQALAWELSANYQAGLWTAGTSKPWQPSAGNLNGTVFNDPNNGLRRTTQPYASQQWNDAAMHWIKNTSGRLSITFHSSYHGNTGPTGCGNYWEQKNWAATNQPAGQYTVHQRNCGFTWYNEIRIFGDKSRMAANTWYWAQAWYHDDGKHDGQFNVDTYWDSQENYQMKYCVIALADRPGLCGW